MHNKTSLVIYTAFIVGNFKILFWHGPYKRQKKLGWNVIPRDEGGFIKIMHCLKLVFIFIDFSFHPPQTFSVGFRSGKHAGCSKTIMLFAMKKFYYGLQRCSTECSSHFRTIERIQSMRMFSPTWQCNQPRSDVPCIT